MPTLAENRSFILQAIDLPSFKFGFRKMHKMVLLNRNKNIQVDLV